MSLTTDRPEKRSPLRHRSLPQAGDSLNDALQDRVARMILIGMVSALLAGLTFVESNRPVTNG